MEHGSHDNRGKGPHRKGGVDEADDEGHEEDDQGLGAGEVSRVMARAKSMTCTMS